MKYDYVIVGAGPTGITIAYLLGKTGKTCALLDQNDSIGGCHRVKRVNGMFTEHSPRVYLSSYVNTKTLLQQMNTSFDALFTPYHFSIASIGSQVVKQLSFWENFILFTEFIQLIYNPFYDKSVSVQTFTQQYEYSAASIYYLDRLCRFSDGAAMDRYSMYQLLQLMNQQLFYQLYQPKLPNDVGLFPIMSCSLEATHHVTTMLNQTVLSLVYDDATRMVTGVQTVSGIVSGSTIVLAVPPPALYKLLTASPSPVTHSFGSLSSWVTAASYNVDIAATFHWDTELTLPIVWGFPYSDWGLISIPLTQYMTMNDTRSKTVISTCITYLDVKSSVLLQSANEIADKDQLVNEMFRQLKETYPTLPPPTTMLLSPTVYRQNHTWVEQDSGFFKSSSISYLSSRGVIPNLYQVGPQNGNGSSSFTTFEAAVTNGIAFVNRVQPSAGMSIASPLELTSVIQWTVIGIVVAVALVFLIRYMIRSRTT